MEGAFYIEERADDILHGRHGQHANYSSFARDIRPPKQHARKCTKRLHGIAHISPLTTNTCDHTDQGNRQLFLHVLFDIAALKSVKTS